VKFFVKNNYLEENGTATSGTDVVSWLWLITAKYLRQSYKYFLCVYFQERSIHGRSYKTSRNLFTLYRNIRIRLFRRTPTLAVHGQCLPTNFIPFTIFVLFYRMVAIFKYSGYSETVKLGGVTNLIETTSA
jgi:hypothetical protein